jgi:RNA polymerase sigma-70 factor (ECF subfamily)
VQRTLGTPSVAIEAASRVVATPASGPESQPAPCPDRNTRLTRLANEHFDFVWRLLRRLGVERAAAEDATQEVFLIALHRLETIDPTRERAFLYGTAVRVAANMRRRVRRQREAPEQVLEEWHASDGLPDSEAESARACALLDRLLRQLPAPLGRVLVLTAIEEMEATEVSELEGIPLGTVASRLRRARAILRKKLARFGWDRPRTEGAP